MKKIGLTLTAALFCFFNTALAQNVKFGWARTFGSTGYDYGTSVALGPDGSVYTVGYFEDTVDFDPGPGVHQLISKGSHDVFISKLNADGQFQWAFRIGGTGDDFGRSIVADSFGDIYVGIQFQGTVDFDPGSGIHDLSATGSYNSVILKLDADGHFIWAKPLLGAMVSIKDITMAPNGFVEASGFFAGSADFNPSAPNGNVTVQGTYDIFDCKFDTAGNFDWVKQMGGTSWAYGQSLATDKNGNLYTVGNYYGTVDFDPGSGVHNLTSAGGDDIYICKLDSTGNFDWAHSIGGTDTFEGASSVAIDDSGNVLVTGTFKGTDDFDPGSATHNLTSNGNQDIFICKFNSNGHYIWAKSIGATQNDQSRSVVTDRLGNVYTTGYFFGTVDFDPGIGTHNLISYGSADIFVVKLNSAGDFVWVKQMGGTSFDFGQSITNDEHGNLFLTGDYYAVGLVDFDPGPEVDSAIPTNSYDIFVEKLAVDCNLDLTVNQNGATLTSAETDADNYQWINCNTNSLISGATNNNFTPTANGSYAVIITKGFCVDTSNCYPVTNLGIRETGTSPLKAYPNPASDIIHIQSGDAETANVKLYNLLGRLVAQQKFENERNFDFKLPKKLSDGMYFLKIQTPNGAVIKKIIVRR